MKKTAGKKAAPAAGRRPMPKSAPARVRKAAPKTAAKAPASKPAPAVTRAAAKRVTKTTNPPPAPRPAARPRPARDAATRKRLAHFRQLLLQQHRRLFTAYQSGKGNTREATSDGTEDYIDYAVNSYDRDFTLSLTELERRQMLLIEEALKRIDRGEYGRCLQCGQEIPEKRLEVEAWARHCVRCQELEEQGLLRQQQQGGFGGDYDEDEGGEEIGDEMEDEAEPDDTSGDDLPGDDSAPAEDDDDEDGRMNL